MFRSLFRNIRNFYNKSPRPGKHLRNVSFSNLKRGTTFLSLGIGASIGALFTYYNWQRPVAALEKAESTETADNVEVNEQADDAEANEQADDDKEPEPEPELFKYVIIGNEISPHLINYMIELGVKSVLWINAENDSFYPLREPLFVRWDKQYRPISTTNASTITDSTINDSTTNKSTTSPTGTITRAVRKYNENMDYVFINGVTVERFSPTFRQIKLSDDSFIQYDKCLIATGSSAKELRIPMPKNSQKITYLRTNEEFENFKNALQSPDIKHVTVVGAGLRGSELVDVLSTKEKGKGKIITHVAPSGVMGRYFPKYLSERIEKQFKEAGVQIMGSKVKAIESNGNSSNNSTEKFSVTLENGKKFDTDFIVVCAGTAPNYDFIKSHVEIDEKNSGLVVNPELLARKNLWVTGSIASHYNVFTKTRTRYEGYQNVSFMGEIAGNNMISAENDPPNIFIEFKSNWLRLGNDSIAFLGEVDNSLENVGIWLKGPVPSNFLTQPISTKLDEQLLEIFQEVEKKYSEQSEIEKFSIVKEKFLTSEFRRINFTDNAYEKNNNYANGIVYYLHHNKVCGALLWNMPHVYPVVPDAIASGRDFSKNKEALKRVLTFEIPEASKKGSP